MDSIREKILQALKTKLESVNGIGTVSRGRIAALDIQRYPAAFIASGSDTPEPLLNDIVDRSWTVYLLLWVKATSNLSQAMEAFSASIRQAAVSDYTLGGLVHDVDEGPMSELIPMNEEETEAAQTIEYTIRYRTARADPYTAAA